MKSHCLAPLAILALAVPALAEAPATLVLKNGQVHTPGGWAEAVAVRDGIIVAVGTTSEIAQWSGPATRTLDLAGATVMPGLSDMHVHALFAGLDQFLCSFPYGATPDIISAAVTACARTTPTGQWIVGGNWVGAVFQPGQQSRAFLDAAAPDHPVLLNDEARHSVWVNSKALALAGITRDTKDPPGGRIERDDGGELTGLLRENATKLVEKIIPEPSPTDKRRGLVLATNQMLSFGITAFTDATVRVGNMSTLSSLSREGLLKQRVRGCIVWAPGDADGERLIAERATWATPRYQTDCVKIFVDGVPTESRTAAMVAPYASDPAHGHGMLMIPQVQLNAAVARFDAQGLMVKFHAAGDGAVRAAIDSVAHARKTNGWGGPMHHVGHNSFVDPTDIPRVRELGMAWEFSPYIWYPTPITAVDIVRAVGPDLMQRFIPIRDAVETGALVVAGSDWSIVPSVNPWIAIETMVTRQKPGGSVETVAPGQRIPIDAALRIFTSNAASLMGVRQQTGSIDVGMRADLIVTDSNPYKIPPTHLHKVRVMLTLIDGKTVYDAENPPQLTAAALQPTP